MNSQCSEVAESQNTVVIEDVMADGDQGEGGATPEVHVDQSEGGGAQGDGDQGEREANPDGDQGEGGTCPDEDQRQRGTCPDEDQKEEEGVEMSLSEEVKDQDKGGVAGGGASATGEVDMLSQSSQSDEESPKPKPTFHDYKTLAEFGYHFNEGTATCTCSGADCVHMLHEV